MVHVVKVKVKIIYFSGTQRVPAYISTIISAAADEGPDEMTCFPAGLHYLLTFPTRMSITQKSMCLYANFSEKGCLDLSGDISPYKFELFQKGEFMESVDLRGNTSLQGLHQQRK